MNCITLNQVIKVAESYEAGCPSFLVIRLSGNIVTQVGNPLVGRSHRVGNLLDDHCGQLRDWERMMRCGPALSGITVGSFLLLRSFRGPDKLLLLWK